MTDESDERDVRRFKWVIGVPYFVQGTSNLTTIPTIYFIKNVLAMGDAGGQLFDSLRSAGWLVKPLWGYISDRVPLFGYRRKSWYVLMAVLALVFWAFSAVLSAAGVLRPSVFSWSSIWRLRPMRLSTWSVTPSWSSRGAGSNAWAPLSISSGPCSRCPSRRQCS